MAVVASGSISQKSYAKLIMLSIYRDCVSGESSKLARLICGIGVLWVGCNV
jgi:hypothetical protein